MSSHKFKKVYFWEVIFDARRGEENLNKFFFFFFFFSIKFSFKVMVDDVLQYKLLLYRIKLLIRGCTV